MRVYKVFMKLEFLCVCVCVCVCVCCVCVCVCVCARSMQTPPGTKVLLLQKVEAQKGFLLLGKSSLKVLGGQVDHLVQKWTLAKVVWYSNGCLKVLFGSQIVPDEAGRSSGSSSDAPQFAPFGSAKPSG